MRKVSRKANENNIQSVSFSSKTANSVLCGSPFKKITKTKNAGINEGPNILTSDWA